MFFWYWKITVPAGIVLALLGMALFRRRPHAGQALALLGCILAVASALWYVADSRMILGNEELLERRYISLEYRVLAQELKRLAPDHFKLLMIGGESLNDPGLGILRRSLGKHVTVTEHRLFMDGDMEEFMEQFSRLLENTDRHTIVLLTVEMSSNLMGRKCLSLLSGYRFAMVNPLWLNEKEAEELISRDGLLVVVNRRADAQYDKQERYPFSDKEAFERRFWIRCAK